MSLSFVIYALIIHVSVWMVLISHHFLLQALVMLQVLGWVLPVYLASVVYTALQWQKEATYKSPKSEKVVFLGWT